MILSSFASDMGQKAAIAVNNNDLVAAQKFNDHFEENMDRNHRLEMKEKFISAYLRYSNNINWF